MGVETQRQWSDKAIIRTTPVLFALYSIIVLIACKLHKKSPLKPEETAWYSKSSVTFSDLLREVRRQLWGAKFFKWSQENPDHEKNSSLRRGSISDGSISRGSLNGQSPVVKIAEKLFKL